MFIETGPHKHAIQQTFFLYVYEPGGNRIELCNPCARLIFAPDWAPISWTQQERAKGQAWGLATITLVPHARNAARRMSTAGDTAVVVAVLGLGEAGSRIAADLAAAGAVVRGFDPLVPAGAGAPGSPSARTTPTPAAARPSCSR